MLTNVEYETDDVDRAERFIDEVYTRASIRDTAAPFAFKQQVIGGERVSIARFSVNSHSTLAVEIDDAFVIGSCVGADYRAASNGRLLDTAQPFMFHPGLAQSWASGMQSTLVNLDRTALAQHAGADSARDRLVVQATAPVTREGAIHWRHVAAHASAVFTSTSLAGSELVRRATEDLVLASAINAFGMTVEGSVTGADGQALPAALRRAVAYIDDHAVGALGVTDIAAAARMSVRGLQVAFRRTLGMTPLEYVRAVRLSGAREQLESADPGSVTLTDVAQRWGFTNLGRFTRMYRETYRELPRETLER
jgi:AraC-like DNA-binding protein